MHTIMKNLVRMWAHEGYKVEGRSTTVAGSELVEAKISFRRADGQPTLLYSEWDKIKALAIRQTFYLLPVSDGGHSGAPEVLLVRRNRIYNIQHVIQDVIFQQRDSYWLIQGDEQILSNQNLAETLWKTAIVLIQDIRVMKSTNEKALIRYFFEDCEPYVHWLEFSSSIRRWTQDMKDCEKVSLETKQLVNKIANLYDY